MIVDSIDVIGKGVNVSWFWWHVDNRLCLDSDGGLFNGFLIFCWWDRRVFYNLSLYGKVSRYNIIPY